MYSSLIITILFTKIEPYSDILNKHINKVNIRIKYYLNKRIQVPF